MKSSQATLIAVWLGMSSLHRTPVVVSGFSASSVAVAPPRGRRKHQQCSPAPRCVGKRTSAASSLSSSLTRCQMLPPGAASLLAGSVAGVIGIGVAFPLDTVNTRSQLQSHHPDELDVNDQEPSKGSRQHSRWVLTTTPVPTPMPPPNNLVDTARIIFHQEGWRGFFPGVRGMMAGESVIKAVAFSANALALTQLQEASRLSLPSSSSLLDSSSGILVTAACFAGLLTAFVVAPVERIKVVLQASPPGTYQNEMDCIAAIWREQGWGGLLLGLDATLARDVPGYGLYFAIYGLLMQSGWDFGPLSPVVFGAAAGSASWIPVYPIDVVKTRLQRNVGPMSDQTPTDAWHIVRQLYHTGGPAAFYTGLTPKLLRAAVNAGTSYSVYESLMSHLSG